MKTVALVACTMVVVGGLTLAKAQSGAQTVTGYLVDVMCATEHSDEGAAYAQKHDKSCLLMDSCVKSGYTVVTADNKVMKLDAKGNALALDLIKKTERKDDWKVAVVGTVSGETIAVSSLTLQ